MTTNFMKFFEPEKVLHCSENSIIYKLKDGRIFKHINPVLIEMYGLVNESLENKIVSDIDFSSVPELCVPEGVVYDSNYKFVGYTMGERKGMTLNEYRENLSYKELLDIRRFAEIFKKVEDIVKRANKLGVVFPDLCTLDNIMIGNNNEISMIDFDGMQIQKYIALFMSSSLGEEERYFTPKYFDDKIKIFTSELDKSSLLVFLFLELFGVDITRVGQYYPSSGREVVWKDIFALTNIKDEVFQNMIMKTMSSNEQGCYFSDILFQLAERYNLEERNIGNT